MASSNIASTNNKFHFQFVPNNPEERKGTYYIDIAQVLSMTQRRAYRQGMNYAVQDMRFIYAPVGPPLMGEITTIDVSRAPCSWMTDNATTMAYMHWMEQRREAIKDMPSLKAKWSDFKVYLDAEHSIAGLTKNLVPAFTLQNTCGVSLKTFLQGEWDVSQLVFPEDVSTNSPAVEKTMHIVGNMEPPGNFDRVTTQSIGLVMSYAQSRANVLAPDPDTQSGFATSPYADLAMHDNMAELAVTNVAENNDEPPYSLLEYPGADANAFTPELVKRLYPSNFGSSTDSISVSIAQTGPFVSPFGLIKIETCGLSTGYDFINVELTLVPGSYKGILAERGV
jgi:hypothetical protein